MILSLWGLEFIDAYIILVILGLGQFINLSTGAVGLTLIMTGYEKTHGNISIVFMLINVILNFILIKSFGATGAAVATSTTIIFENITKMIYVKIKTNINTIPFIRSN